MTFNGNGSQEKPKHLKYANAMRNLAITVGVLIHVQVWFIRTAPRFEEVWWAASIINIANRWCVPVLFMLSGALLLDPNRKESTEEFYKKRLKRIGVPILFWSIFYLVWRSVVLNEPSLRPKVMLSNIVFGKPSYHLWFMYALIWLYLFTPILRSFWHKITTREKWGLTIFILSISSISTLLWTYSGEIGWRIPPSPVITIEWIFYIGYFLLGFLIRDIRLKKGSVWIIAGVWLVIVASSSFGYYALSKLELEFRAQGIFHSYLSPLVIITSIAAFLIIKTIFSKEQGKISQFINSSTLGSASFGVYLVHIAVLDVLTSVLNWRKVVGTTLGSFFLLLFIVPILSYVLVLILRRLPIIKRIFG